MTSITDLGAQAWRDYATDGVPSSGALNTPKSAARAVMAAIDIQKAEMVADLGALKALTSRPGSVLVRTGRAAGVWQWVSGSSTTADDALVVTPTSGAAGRYKRVYDGALQGAWFGMSAEIADNAAALSAALEATEALTGVLQIGPGRFPFTTAVSHTLSAKIVLRGSGNDATILQWTGAIDGLSLTFDTQYHAPVVESLSLQTTTAGAGTALAIIMSPALTTANDIGPCVYDVDVIGFDPATDYWTHGVHFVDCWYPQVETYKAKGKNETAPPFSMLSAVKYTRCQGLAIKGGFYFQHIQDAVLQAGTVFGEGLSVAGPGEVVGVNKGFNLTSWYPITANFAVTIASPGVCTSAAHGMDNGTPVVLSTTGALPTGLSIATTYYAVNKTADTFQLSLTLGGDAIDTGGSQSGVHSFTTGNRGLAIQGIQGVHINAYERGVSLSGIVQANISGNFIYKTHISAVDHVGIELLLDCTNCRLIGNHVEDNPAASGAWTGILVGTNAAFNTVVGNTFDYAAAANSDGVAIGTDAHDNLIIGNIAAGNGEAIDTVSLNSDAGNNIIIGNRSASGVAVASASASAQTIAGNSPLPTQTLAVNDTTPSVRGAQHETWQTNNNVSTTITALDDGVYGQEVTILLDANTGFTHNASTFVLNGGRDIPVGAGDGRTITLKRYSGKWVEESRSWFLGANTFFGAQDINLNSGALPAAIAATGLRIGGENGASVVFSLDSFGLNTAIVGRRANGTAASLTSVQSGDVLFGLAARGYGATAYSATGRAAVNFFAAENWTDAAQGAYFTLNATPTGSATMAEVARVDGAGFKVASGKEFRLGNAYASGAPTPTGYLVLYDSAGVAYKVPAEAV